MSISDTLSDKKASKKYAWPHVNEEPAMCYTLDIMSLPWSYSNNEGGNIPIPRRNIIAEAGQIGKMAC